MQFQDFLMNKLDKNVYRKTVINFTANTQVRQVQNQIMSKLSECMKNVYGPPINQSSVSIVYISHIYYL